LHPTNQNVKANRPAEQAAFKKPTLEKYESESSCYYSTARLWDDGVIDPVDTRLVLAQGLAAAGYKVSESTRFGLFRM
jgi:3-methylcrotonyl-CoA carboxylase beta subunit